MACAVVVAGSPSAASAVTTSCGASLPNGSGGYRTCTFGDTFSGTRLNISNWQPLRTATSGFRLGGECYVDDQSHVKVAGGFLTLTATKSSSPQRCIRSYSTRYQSGMVMTKDRFSQAYGRFEARMKMPAGTGFQSAFWMWPHHPAYGQSSGEIDIAEWYGLYPDFVSPTLHMRDADGVDHPKNTYCRVADAEEAFHTYAVEWQPTGFTFYYDGAPCMTVSNWDPGAPMVAPQPFDRPFFMLLTLGLGYGGNAVTSATPFPAKFVIDYVRAWR